MLEVSGSNAVWLKQTLLRVKGARRGHPAERAMPPRSKALTSSPPPYPLQVPDYPAFGVGLERDAETPLARQARSARRSPATSRRRSDRPRMHRRRHYRRLRRLPRQGMLAPEAERPTSRPHIERVAPAVSYRQLVGPLPVRAGDVDPPPS